MLFRKHVIVLWLHSDWFLFCADNHSEEQEGTLSSRTLPHQLCMCVSGTSGRSRNSNMNTSIHSLSDAWTWMWSSHRFSLLASETSQTGAGTLLQTVTGHASWIRLCEYIHVLNWGSLIRGRIRLSSEVWTGSCVVSLISCFKAWARFSWRVSPEFCRFSFRWWTFLQNSQRSAGML